MISQTTELISLLNTLLRLTAHEAATARARVSQATTDATRRELTQNAAKGDQRATAIRQAVRDLGGAPDVVGVALGKAAAAAKLPLEQTMPVSEALLADLALEHQLFDRARLVKVLAADADAADLVALAERLENAHGDTIQWLFTVLAETALGGPAALAPTALQIAAGTARSAATFASSAAASGLNKAVATAGTLTDRTGETVTHQVSRLKSLSRSARKVVGAGREATLSEAEVQTRKQFGTAAANTVHHVREDLGVIPAAELPIAAYDRKSAVEVAKAVAALHSTDDLHVVLAYEKAHKNRQAVITAVTRRVTQLARELINT